MQRNQSLEMPAEQEKEIDQEVIPQRSGVIGGIKFLVTRKKWHEKNLGQYIHQRLNEENLTMNDLDEDTINFFFQQFKIDKNMKMKQTTKGKVK
jgi:hypothetical protein